MKKLIRLTFLFTLLLIPTTHAQLPFIVQVVYFKPVGAPPVPDTIAEVMQDVQTLYRTEMERNGYGAKTFRLETDNTGQVIVHTVNGRQNTAHYRATTYDSIKAELPNRFLNQNNITVIIAGGLRLIDNRVWGIGFPIYGWVCGGQALIAAENPNFGVPLIAHELGHAFGLYHNIIGDPSIMGRGRGAPADVIEFNDYETRWLDKHHYFNEVHAIAHIPEVVHSRRFREVQQDIIRFRFDIESLGELHQAQVYRLSDVAIVGWVRLSGNLDTAEFLIRRDRLKNQKRMGVQMMDTLGNHNILHVSLGDLPNHIVDPNKNEVLVDGNVVTPPNPTSTDTDAPKKKLSTSPQGKLVLLWARLRMRAPSLPLRPNAPIGSACEKACGFSRSSLFSAEHSVCTRSLKLCE